MPAAPSTGQLLLPVGGRCLSARVTVAHHRHTLNVSEDPARSRKSSPSAGKMAAHKLASERRELIPALVPTVTGWFGQANPFAFDVKHLDPAPSARRFQSGSPPVPSIYSTVPGLKLLMNTGMENVAERVQHLTRKLMEGAEKLGIESKTPADSVGPLVVLRAHDAEALVKKLAERDIAASARRDGLRISFHLYNSDQDVQSLLMALEHNLDLLVTKHPAAAGH